MHVKMPYYDISRICPGKCPQIIATVTACFTVFSDGMQFGWSSPIIPRLLSPSSPITITEVEVVWLETIYLIGGIVGLAIVYYLVDRMGRKNTLLLSASVGLLSWTLMACAKTSSLLYIGRFIAGISADLNFITIPIYLSEISDKLIRGRLCSMGFVMMLLGVFAVYCIGPFISIVNTSIFGAFVLFIQLLTFPFMPETPYYLLMKKKDQDARNSLEILRSSKHVDDEFKEIFEAVKLENETKKQPLDLFRIKSNRYALLIVVTLNFAQQLTGIVIFLMNVHTILENATAMSATAISILFAVMMLISSIAATFFIDFHGRKALLVISSFLTSFILFVLAIYFTVQKTGINVHNFTWLPVVIVMCYAVAFKYGLGFIPVILASEMFPTNIKTIGCTIGDISYVIASSLSVKLYYFLSSSFGMDAPFYLFSACAFLSGLFCIFFVPETKGKTLDEIQKLLKSKYAPELENIDGIRNVSSISDSV